MTRKTQPFIVKIEFVIGSVAKKRIYKAAILGILGSTAPNSDLDEHRFHIVNIGDEVRRRDLKKEKNAAVAVKVCDGVEVSGCRIRVTYARPRTRGQGRQYYSNNLRCYQCGNKVIFTEIA